MKGGVKVVDNDWRTALAEAVRRRGERDALARDGQQLIIISPDTTEQEVLNDDK
jgi:hypothetical protein